ncbi:rhomboid family intramembrane serine protease [Natrinema thermotolerans]
MARPSSSQSTIDLPPDSGSEESGPRSSSAVLEVLAVFVLVFVVQGLTALVGVMGTFFVLRPPLAADPWTIVTSVYAHDGLGHLVSNGLALIVFGWPVARATTRARFHAFVAVTGATAGTAQIVLTRLLASVPLITVAPSPGVLGASGAVFALLGYLLASNRLSSGLGSLVDVPPWLSALVVVGLAVAVTVATASPGVALLAHFVGFLVGAVAGRARILAVGSSDGSDATRI